MHQLFFPLYLIHKRMQAKYVKNNKYKYIIYMINDA